MKKVLFMVVMGVVFMVTANFLYAQQPSGGWYCPRAGGNMQHDNSNTQQGWHCPWCSQSMRGGMMYQGGYGHGMMGGTVRGMKQGSVQTPVQPLSKEQVVLLLNNYLRNINNPNLKLGKVTEQDKFYEAQIVTKEESLVDKIQVNKSTGLFRSAYVQ